MVGRPAHQFEVVIIDQEPRRRLAADLLAGRGIFALAVDDDAIFTRRIRLGESTAIVARAARGGHRMLDAAWADDFDLERALLEVHAILAPHADAQAQILPNPQ